MSSKQQTYKGKKWCEYCRTQINWTKEDIAFHEQSRTHKKNVEREIEFKRQKIIREQEQAKKATDLDDSAKLMQEIEKKAQEAMQNTSQRNPIKIQFEGQANLKNPQIGPSFPAFQFDKEPELTEEQQKELKRQKKKEELGSEFGSSYEESDTDEEQDKYRDDEIEFKMTKNKEELAQKFDRVWYLSKDEKTGKLFFYNQLSGQRKYEKPIGLKLLDEEQRLWDEYILQQVEEQEKQEEAEQEAINQKAREYRNKNKLEGGDNDNQDGQNEQNEENQANDQEGIIKSDWVEVTEEDNFFNKYAVRNVYGEVLDNNKNDGQHDDEEDEDDGMDDEQAKKLARIELLIEQGKIQTQSEMIQALMQTSEGGNTMKQNEKLKKIIESNLDIQSDTKQKTYKKKNWLEDEEDSTNVKQQKPVNNNQQQDQQQVEQKAQTKGSLFKKRINNNKNVQNIPIDDN